LAAVILRIGRFISLIGAVPALTFEKIAPHIMHTMILWEDFEGASGKSKITRNIFLYILGIVGIVSKITIIFASLVALTLKYINYHMVLELRLRRNLLRDKS
jgi:hypothetical protein